MHVGGMDEVVYDRRTLHWRVPITATTNMDGSKRKRPLRAQKEDSDDAEAEHEVKKQKTNKSTAKSATGKSKLTEGAERHVELSWEIYIDIS